jgi:hypothetical protein
MAKGARESEPLGALELLFGVCTAPDYEVRYAHAKNTGTCIMCGKPAAPFENASARLEYSVSALCQGCQEVCFTGKSRSRPTHPEERRVSERRKAREGTFVGLKAGGRKLWQIIDIGMDGLSFRYIPGEVQLDRASELDIVTGDTLFLLERVPFISVSDFELGPEGSTTYCVRRHGVQFGHLTSSRKSMLKYLLHHYTDVSPNISMSRGTLPGFRLSSE